MVLKDNTVPYIAMVSMWIVCIILILNTFQIIVFDYKHTMIILIISMSIPSHIYYKYHTIPITEAISDYWKYKIKKQDESKPKGRDYASFKDTQNKDKK